MDIQRFCKTAYHLHITQAQVQHQCSLSNWPTTQVTKVFRALKLTNEPKIAPEELLDIFTNPNDLLVRRAYTCRMPLKVLQTLTSTSYQMLAMTYRSYRDLGYPQLSVKEMVYKYAASHI